MTVKILFVDDDTRILSAFKRRLFKKYKLDVASGAEQGLRLIQSEGPYAVVISDQRMPGVQGTEFLKEVKSISPLTTRIMLTGNADRQTAIDSVNESQVFRYFNKPCSLDDLEAGIEDGIRHHQLLAAERDLLEQSLSGSVNLLVELLSCNDPEHFKQIGPMRKAGKTLAAFMNHPNAWELDMTILLSEIGAMMLPPDLRAKRIRGDALNEREEQLVEDTPKVARDLLLNIPRMSDIAGAIYYQDKGYDGSGYPHEDETAGDGIPLNARIFKVLRHLHLASNGQTIDSASFDALRPVSESLDGKIIDIARRCFVRGDQASAEEQDLTVKLDDLRPDDKLLEDLKSESGDMALTAGNVLTDAMIQKLMQYHQLRPLKEPVRILRIAEAAPAAKTAA